MSTYIIVDNANLFSRGRHAVRGDADLKVGMALHIVFSAVKKAWEQFDADHVVFCFEGRSWRKDHYAPYKRNRTELRAAQNVKEQDEEKVFWETVDYFKEFVTTKTNCTVLQNPILEADDLIAGFVQAHPNDKHIIISTDTDFVQLISDNVVQYNGVDKLIISKDGVRNEKGKLLEFTVKSDSKLKIGKPNEDFVPEEGWTDWSLFLKCMRGDTSDNVFSAFPGARIKGSKNKVGLTEAYQDKENKGWAWNNLMLQRWSDHKGEEHRVLDDFQRNQVLIDLTKQPDHIREAINETIRDNAKPKNVEQVGIRMLKFCNLFDLKRISDSIQGYAPAFQATYKED